MLQVAVVTLFPGMLDAVIAYGVTRRAVERGLVRIDTENPRDYTHDRHRTVDDRPYGGGPGMVMLVEPLRAALAAARRRLGGDATTVYLTPQGRRLDQAGVERLVARRRLVLVCGRYEGVDERLVEREIDLEVSVGDYVLAGGELPAMVLIEAMTRLVPGALGHEDSAREDSFGGSGLLDCPHYSRPEVLDGRRVPAVLLSGDHAAVARWRRKQALGRTWVRRPDLLKQIAVDEEDQRLLDEYCAEQRADPGTVEARNTEERGHE